MDSINDLFEWGSNQIDYVLYVVMFVMILFFAFKRAWIALISTIVGLAFLAIFVTEPVILIRLAEWLAGKLSVLDFQKEEV